jgi:hypothetical protein
MTVDKHTDNKGRVWVSSECLSFGDYGGGGSVARANINIIEAEHSEAMTDIDGYDWSFDEVPDGIEIVRQSFGCGGIIIWFLEGTDIEQEISAALEDYPVLDDDELCRVEMEWTEDAMPDALSDLRRLMYKDLEIEYLVEYLDTFPKKDGGKTAIDLIYEAMEIANEYPKMEYSSAYINVDNILNAFLSLLDKHKTEVTKENS